MPNRTTKKYDLLFTEVVDGRNAMFKKLYDALTRDQRSDSSSNKAKTFNLRKTDSGTENCSMCKHLRINPANAKKLTYACEFISKENQKLGYLDKPSTEEPNGQIFNLFKPPKEIVCDRFEAGGDPNNIEKI